MQKKNAKKRVLVVEDELSLLKAIETMLEASGFEVIIASHAEEATAKIFLYDDRKPDLIWLDINLPHLNGLDFLEKIRDDEKFTNTPVIIVTNYGDAVTRARAKKMGVNAFFVKSDHELGEIIDSVRELTTKT